MAPKLGKAAAVGVRAQYWSSSRSHRAVGWHGHPWAVRILDAPAANPDCVTPISNTISYGTFDLPASQSDFLQEWVESIPFQVMDSTHS